MKLKSPQNKWFIAFVIAAVVAVAAIVVAIVGGVKPQQTGDPAYVEGPETGVYYYDVIDGEIILTLSGGNKFTISGPWTNKTGTYTVDGTNMVLDFFKDEDGSTTATINGDTIALVYDNATMTFLKKTVFTVNFQVNGGSQIETMKIVNGKTVLQPADPTKENSVFLGWYADEALTVPFDFAATTVKADTTIYARWAQKQIGAGEYTVEFDLGYEGAEPMAPITTIAGQAYGVTTPERAGFTFGGWWISMYEDGQKLSYAYTENTVFTADTTLFAVWHSEGGSKLQAPAVSVTGSTISWSAVKGAASYKLTILDPDGNILIDNETVGATVKTFDFTDRKAGAYTVSVTAVASNEANNSDAAIRYYANKTLDRVTDFTVVNGILVFGAVENAERYAITIQCGNAGHSHTAFDNGNSTTYYMGNCPMQEGGIRITVTATANGYAPSTSKVFVYNKVLEQIDQMRYDEQNDQFQWNPVADAMEYYVTVTVDGQQYTFNNGNSTSFSMAGFSGEITVSVTPATAGYNSPEAIVGTCKKTAPAAPSGLTAAGLVISWDPVAGATSYEVNINGQNMTATTNRLDLESTGHSLVQGQVYDVKVKAINASNESSAYSEVVKIGYYAMNPYITYERNTVYWSPVLGASRYQVRVNGGAIMNVADACSAKITLTKEGENLIEVRYANGDTASEWATMTVTACAVEYDTRSVAYGSFFVEYLAVGDELSLPTTGFAYDGYQFSAWYNTPKGAAGNGKRYEKGDVFTGNAYTVIYAEWEPESYKVILKTEGFTITNLVNNQEEEVIYTRDFVLPVPNAKNTGVYIFSGWYTGPNGTGVQVTDKNGVSVSPFSFTRDMTLYPFFSTDALVFITQDDGTYGVYRGDSISSVTHLEIPAYHNNIAVTKILESAFNHPSCYNLVSVKIPDTVTLVGASAFTACTALESIEVYKAKEGDYETFYSSENGVLIREDMGTTYLEFVPRAKTGDFIIPECVDKILTRAFYFSSLDNVIIPDNVISIPKYAFYNCQSLKSIAFQTGRTNEIEIGEWAFYGCTTVETISLPAKFNVNLENLTLVLDMIENLKSITVENGGTTYGSVGGMLTNKEKNTILYCPKAYAGAVSIPNGITSIGDRAFVERQKITAITIPVWVTNIGASAFEACQGVKEITFKGSRSDNLTIGDSAFLYCTDVTTITFEGNGANELDTGKVTIGANAFSNVRADSRGTLRSGSTRLTTVNIGDGVNITSIGNKAFYYQSKLRELNIAEGVSIGSIGQYAFDKCERLITVTIPASVTKIAEYAFSRCTSLTVVDFRTDGNAALEISNYAFNGCTKLGQILLPDRLNEFKSAAFEGCDALKAILVTATNPNYLNDANGILYKKNANNTLSELLFYPKGLAQELGGVIDNLPNTLTKIGGSAFSANKYLVSITIPKTVTTIDVSAFANCENLKTVNFQAGGTTLTVGSKAFLGCTALEGFQLPAYTTSIGANAFENCAFTSFTVPAKVTSIGLAAFKNCKNLEELKFNTTGSLTVSVGGAASTGTFVGCDALKTVAFPKGLTELGKYAFYQCQSLETVTFGNVTKNADGSYTTDSTLTTINNYAFSACPNLKTVIVPKTVTVIGTGAFAMTEAQPGSLENLIFEPYGTQQLAIYNSVFAYQTKLQVLNLPARTQYLYNTSVKATVTSSLEYVNVFKGTISLAEINILNDRVNGVNQYFTSIDGVLYNGSKTAVLYCPMANVGRYVNGQPTYELIIPNTVQTVMTYAFQNNTKLKTLTFQEFDKSSENYGKPLLTIGNYVYEDANGQISAVRNKYTGSGGFALSAIGGDKGTISTGSAIATINLPSHLAKINSGAFASNSEQGVTINFNPDTNNLELANFAFTNSRMVEVNIPGTLASVGENAFRESILLKSASFNLPEDMTKLPDNLFHGCVALESYEIPQHITEISQYAFYNCKALKHINLHEGLKKLNNSCFSSCGLESVTLPSTITNQGLFTADSKGQYTVDITNLFSGCQSLKTVIFAPGVSGKSPVTWIPKYMFSNCSALETVNFNDMNLLVINNYAFSGCKKLANVDFTKMRALYYIGSNAFNQNALTYVDLSKTQVTALYMNAFGNMTTLETFIFPNSISTVQTPFNNCTSLKYVTLASNTTGAMLEQFKGMSLVLTIPSGSKYLVQDSYGVVYDPSYQTLYYAGGANDLTGYVMPSSVVSISPYAFAYAKADSLTISEGVKTIGNYAFLRSEIPVISISSTVETIGQYAFQYAGVKQLTFANEHNSRLNSLGAYAFQYSKLQSIVLPDNLNFTTTNYYVFYFCYDLKSVTLGAKVKYVPANLVNGCYSLEEIHFQEGVETINNLYSFWNTMPQLPSNKVTSVTIPSTVKTLADGAFAYFENLQNVTFAAGSQLESMGKGCFINCFDLENINVPGTVLTLGEQAFRHCYSLQSVNLSATGITTIYQNSFENTGSLAVLNLPNNLETIGDYAFKGTGVVDLSIPATVLSIGQSAFENATAMKTLIFAADSMLEELGSVESYTNVFKNTVSLETVVLPNFLKTIGNGTFENSGVSEVVMADSSATGELQQLGAYAFANCANLTDFAHLGKVTTIGEAAFMNCTALTSAPVSDRLDYLGEMAFAFCDQLANVRIPASVTELGGNPFAGMQASQITLDPDNTFFTMETDANGVTTIYDAAKSIIYGIYGATGVYHIDSNATMLQAGALAGNEITQVVFPVKITMDGDYMFMNCTKLTEVSFTNEITYIGKYAFYQTAISTLEIPASVTKIDNYAFAYCLALDHMTIPATVTTFGNYCFAYCASLSDFTFQESSSTQTMGTHFFYQCPNITQVILPTKFANTLEDAVLNGQNNSYRTGAIPSYTFAGTGIVNAVLPASTTYYYTSGVFADCKDLEVITFENLYGSQNASGRINPSWLDGCDNFRYACGDTLKDSFANVVESVYFGGIRQMRIRTVKFDNATEMGVGVRFYLLDESMCLYFEEMSYEELIPLFVKIQSAWNMKIYDKDGNLLVSSEENGAIASVLDANGNVIWEANAE